MRTERCASLAWSVSFSTREAPHFLNTEQWLTRLRQACQRMTLLAPWRDDAKPCAVVERGEKLFGPLWVKLCLGDAAKRRPLAIAKPTYRPESYMVASCQKPTRAAYGCAHSGRPALPRPSSNASRHPGIFIGAAY